MKRWRKLNLQSLQKKDYLKNKTQIKAYVSTSILATFLATYLDLWFIGKEFYTFPHRPFPTIFSINVYFTLVFIPIFTIIVISILKRLSPLLIFLFIALLSLLTPIMEQIAEQIGMFQHSSQWQHYYSIIGYFVFIFIIWKFYNWMMNE